MKKILLSAALVAIALSFGGCAKHEMKESAAPAGDTTKQAYENARLGREADRSAGREGEEAVIKRSQFWVHD